MLTGLAFVILGLLVPWYPQILVFMLSSVLVVIGLKPDGSELAVSPAAEAARIALHQLEHPLLTAAPLGPLVPCPVKGNRPVGPQSASQHDRWVLWFMGQG